MKKPTGNGKRPAQITRAKAIDLKINKKISLRHIDDADIDNDDPSDTSDHEPPPSNANKVRTAVACSGRSDVPEPHRTRAHQTAELVGKIATALDPETQRARDEERANSSLQQTQFLALNQQLRDSQQLNQSLRAELDQLRDWLYKVECICDRLDLELGIEWRMNGMATLSTGHQPQSRKHDPGLQHVRGKIRSTIDYPEGGSCTTWHTDGSSASEFDENKENEFPQSFLASPSQLHSRKPLSSTTEPDTSNSTDLPRTIPSDMSLEV